MVAFKFDPVDLLFSAGGAAAAMMTLHFVHVQVRGDGDTAGVASKQMQMLGGLGAASPAR
jgi:hypothetical protein